MGRYILRTLGCKANLSDSQSLELELQKQGWTPEPQKSSGSERVDLCIVNSCTVTDEAEKQSRKTATRLARENPHATVVITGCGAEVDPQALTKTPGVHFVVGNQNKPELTRLVLDQLKSNPSLPSYIQNTEKPEHNTAGIILGTAQTYTQVLSRHPMDREWPQISESFYLPENQTPGHTDRTRSFIKIQEGCNSFCTYCIIPYGRGPSRSLKPQILIQQIRNLILSGTREVILTGTNIGDYGTDWGNQAALGELIGLILQTTELQRLRVSSLDPTEITPEIIQLMREYPKRFCPHFHVSLQSPHSRVLKLMKRKYSFDEVSSCLNQLSQLPCSAPGGVYVGMDLITGFPGESLEEFDWGYQALKELPWHRLHVFPYSERQGTPATRLPGSVPKQERLRRAKLLHQLSLQRLTQSYRALLTQCQSQNLLLENVLMEKQSPQGWSSGYTVNYFRIMLPPGHQAQRNELITVRPLDVIIDSKAQDAALVCEEVKKR